MADNETLRTEAQWNNILTKLEQIRELRDRASTPDEANAAAAALTRMLTKYSLSMVEFESRLGNGTRHASGAVKATIEIENTAAWRQLLLTVIARTNGCRAIFMSGSKEVFMVGPQKNIDLATDLYGELVALAEVMSRRASREPANARAVHAAGMRVWRRSYLIGFGSGLGDAMRAARKQAADEMEGGSALVVVQDQNLDKAVSDLIGRTRPTGASRVNGAAHQSGYNDGKTALTKRLG